MAMLSSFLNQARAPAPPGPIFSPAAGAAAVVLRKQRPAPAAAASVVALRWASASCKQSRRAPLFVCHAQQDNTNKYKYDIQPNALQTPPTLAGEHWNVMGDKDLVVLKFRVGESMTKDKVKVETTPDQTHLVIRYTSDTRDDVQASELNVQLAMPPGYDGNKVHPRLFDGWLVILIAKPKHNPNKRDIVD